MPDAKNLKIHTWWHAGGTCSWSAPGHSGAPQELLAVPCSPAAVSGCAWKSIQLWARCYIKSSPKSYFVQCKQMLGSSQLISSGGLHTSAGHANSTTPWLYLLPSNIFTSKLWLWFQLWAQVNTFQHWWTLRCFRKNTFLKKKNQKRNPPS